MIRAAGTHPVPSRTRSLSPPAPMVLQGKPCGRVGHCHRSLFFVACQANENREFRVTSRESRGKKQNVGAEERLFDSRPPSGLSPRCCARSESGDGTGHSTLRPYGDLLRGGGRISSRGYGRADTVSSQTRSTPRLVQLLSNSIRSIFFMCVLRFLRRL